MEVCLNPWAVIVFFIIWGLVGFVLYKTIGPP
jgi:hypothetical protein